MKKVLFFVLLPFIFANLSAETTSKTITYQQDTTILNGYLAFDNSIKGKRPGILVVHEWWGQNEFAKTKARELALLGYVALAVDMYGKGWNTTDPQMAGKMAGSLRGTPLLRERILAGLTALRAQEMVDTNRMAAIGFCFGGTSVLELAYSGANVKGIVAFHAGIVSPKNTDLPNIKAKILVLHGADDPNVPADTIGRFQESMRKAKADWQMIYYGNSVHAFTNPNAGNDNSKGAAYNKPAAERSWKAMQQFFREIF